MYETLIEALRKVDEYDSGYAKLMYDAADAIEAQDRHILTLQHEMMAEAESHIAIVERLSKQNKNLEEALKTALDFIPCWIPVTERLPEPKFAREWYLVVLESGCVKTLAFEKQGRSDNLFRPGWHETASPVTHWMPFPEPPKEGEI